YSFPCSFPFGNAIPSNEPLPLTKKKTFKSSSSFHESDVFST
ncbi:MAG: hypothetical protein ACI8SA_001638, partial [Dokdonia sp.]